ncbi:multidrug DMT transporter permease [Jannaschia sp. EhC01]|nr:multidrug DMT transporter permease [Jannaschia sp. EhC01]
MSTQSDPPSNVPLAALWMIGAVVAFSSMAVAGRELSTSLSTFELMTYRSAIGMVLVVAVGAAAGTLGQISTTRLRGHTLRNVFHFIGQNLWFLAVGLIPLAQLFALEFTSPLWVMALAALFLGERLTPVKIGAGVMGFLGVLIVVQPGSVPFSIGMGAALLAAVCFAITAIFTKRLTRDQSITCILFWLTLIQLILGLVFCLYDGHMALPSAATLPWIIVIGIAGLLAHFCLTSAFAHAPASVVMPIDFARLPLIAVVGMIFYAEPLQWGVLIGAVLIFGANYMNILAEHRRSRSPAMPMDV